MNPKLWSKETIKAFEDWSRALEECIRYSQKLEKTYGKEIEDLKRGGAPHDRPRND